MAVIEGAALVGGEQRKLPYARRCVGGWGEGMVEIWGWGWWRETEST